MVLSPNNQISEPGDTVMVIDTLVVELCEAVSCCKEVLGGDQLAPHHELDAKPFFRESLAM